MQRARALGGWQEDLLFLPGNNAKITGGKLGEGVAQALLFFPLSTDQTGQSDVLTNVLYCTFSMIITDFVKLKDFVEH